MIKDLRVKRHFKIRNRIVGTPNRPRLAVFRSTKHIYAQLIDDVAGKTLVAASDVRLGKMVKSEKAFLVGEQLAKKAIKQKITVVVFDRGGFVYHGRVRKLSEGARVGGLKF